MPALSRWTIPALFALLAFASGANGQEKPGDPTGQTPPKQAEKDTVAPDIKPGALWDGRKMAPFRAMDFPKMVKAADADFLEDSEYVLGMTVNGESRAYPTRFIGWHHIINDKVGSKEAGNEAFVTVTY